MKNDKTMKTKTPATASINTVKAPAAIPARKRSAKAPAAETPITPAGTPTAVLHAAPADAARLQTRPSTNPQVAPQSAHRREITSDLIAQRAYVIWEQQGRPQGREKDNWLLAESQLKQEIQSFTA